MSVLAEKIREQHGLPVAKVAKAVGCSEFYVKWTRWRDRNPEVARRSNRNYYHRSKKLQSAFIPWTAEHLLFLERNWPKMTGSEIAAALGRSRASVVGKAGRLGLKK